MIRVLAIIAVIFATGKGCEKVEVGANTDGSIHVGAEAIPPMEYDEKD